MSKDLQIVGGHYELMKLVRTSSTFDHYQAKDLRSNFEVAVKVLHEELTLGPQFRRRFLAEMRALAGLRHPHLISLLDYGIEDRCCFLVLEPIEGVDLRRQLDQQGKLPLGESLRIAQQVAAGLGLVHAAGLVHGDVRPENVLLPFSGQAKLANLGMAKLLSGLDRLREGERRPEFQYWSPERAAGQEPAPSNDVYSLGLVLLEMLGGGLPSLGKEPRAFSPQPLNLPAPPLGGQVPDLAHPVAVLLDRMLERDPGDRYRDGNETAAAIRRVAEDLGAEPLREAPTVPAAPESPTALETPWSPDEGGGRIDWEAVGLAFLALVAIGGLFPLWVWVYFLYHSPVP